MVYSRCDTLQTGSWTVLVIFVHVILKKLFLAFFLLTAEKKIQKNVPSDFCYSSFGFHVLYIWPQFSPLSFISPLQISRAQNAHWLFMMQKSNHWLYLFTTVSVMLLSFSCIPENCWFVTFRECFHLLFTALNLTSRPCSADGELHAAFVLLEDTFLWQHKLDFTEIDLIRIKQDVDRETAVFSLLHKIVPLTYRHLS